WLIRGEGKPSTSEGAPWPVKTYRGWTHTSDSSMSAGRNMISRAAPLRSTCPMRTTVWLRPLILLALCCCVLRGVAEAQVQPKRILILYEVGTAYPGVNQIEQGLRAAFDTSHDKLEIYREYMETVLFPDLTDQERFREFYIRKYRDRRPDVIITV